MKVPSIRGDELDGNYRCKFSSYVGNHIAGWMDGWIHDWHRKCDTTPHRRRSIGNDRDRVSVINGFERFDDRVDYSRCCVITSARTLLQCGRMALNNALLHLFAPFRPK